MTTRAQIVREALEWEHMKFGHQMSTKGFLCDCRGLISGVVQQLGMYQDFVCPAYRRIPDSKQMMAELLKWLDIIPFSSLKLADIIWFRVRKAPQHLGLVVCMEPITILHALWRPEDAGEVIKQTFSDGRLRSKVVACFRYRGLED